MYLNNFQSYTFGAVLIFMMCFAACEKTPLAINSIPYGQNTDLKAEQTIYFGTTIKDGLKVSVDQISDSRCPLNVTCIWAGEASVRLNIRNLNDSIKVDLKINPAKNSQPDTLVFNLHQSKYQAILYSVNPYPDNSKPSSYPNAKITLIKK